MSSEQDREARAMDRLTAIMTRDPDISAIEASLDLGVSRQRVYALAAQAGIRFRGKVSSAFGTHSPSAHLSPHFVGAAAELTVCGDLMRMGWPVYRACAPVGECDLVVAIGDRLLRVEVRSAHRKVNGELRCAAPARDRWDVLAMVERDGRVTYRPPLEA